MNKITVWLIALGMALTLPSKADSFTLLWKQQEEAQQKDLPRSQLNILKRIAQKAEREKAYGHLLKARLWMGKLQTAVSPDSLKDELERLYRDIDRTPEKDEALTAVYNAAGALVLDFLGKNAPEDKARQHAFAQRALAHPDVLANVSAGSYTPFVEEGADSRIFNNDLLHVVGMALKRYDLLHHFYEGKGNKPAACIAAALWMEQESEKADGPALKSAFLQRVDSLIEHYRDIKEAGKLAIIHYNYINNRSEVTDEQRAAYINYALSKWGAWSEMNELRNAYAQLTQPTFNVNIGDALQLPRQPRLLRINMLRNINALTLNVWHLNVAGDTWLRVPDKASDLAKLKQGATLLEAASQTKHYNGIPADQTVTDSMTLCGLPEGVYLLEFSTDNNNIIPRHALLRVTNLFAIQEQLPDNSLRMVVVNATTGEPIPHASVEITREQVDNVPRKVNIHKKNTVPAAHEILQTNAKGELLLDDAPNRYATYRVFTERDKAAPAMQIFTYYNYNTPAAENKTLQTYTDRAIYRPGQTVHVATIATMVRRGEEAEVLPQQSITFTLVNPSGKDIDTRSATTDAFGTAHASFVLPQNGLTGYYYLRVNNSYGTGFSVEAYKRPTFRVLFDEVNTAYAPGDSIILRGKAETFAGQPVLHAKAVVKVSRQTAVWFRRYMPSNNGAATLLNDTLNTDEQGRFTLKIRLDVPQEQLDKQPMFYTIKATADITDLAGETQHGELSLPLGTRSTSLTVIHEDKMRKDLSKKLLFDYRNAAGKPIEGTVIYRIDQGATHTVKANEELTLDKEKLSSGLHTLQAVCGTDTVETSFTVFALDDKRPAITTDGWFYASDNTFATNDTPIYIQVGASYDNQYIFYSLFSENKILENGVIKQSNAVNTRKFSYNKSYGSGLTATYAWVRNGKLYRYTAPMNAPRPDTHLNLTWKTFRDKLTPGDKETWSLQATDDKGHVVEAQLLATLYDSSLDQLRKPSWNFHLPFNRSVPAAGWHTGNVWSIGVYGYQEAKMANTPSLSLSKFNDDVLRWLPYSIMTTEEIRPKYMVRGTKSLAAAAPEEVRAFDTASIKQKTNSRQAAPEAEVTNETAGNTLQVRQNMNETAFFYPTVETDKNGLFTLRFTLPESVTTWKFMAIAHDKQVRHGYIETQAVASKPVMVTPNVPRFLRQGDKAVLATRITNTTSQTQKGQTVLQLINAETGKVVIEQRTNFTVKPKDVSAVRFNIPLKDDMEPTLYIYKVWAEGNGFSDGEQHYLPVLPIVESITTTTAFALADHEATHIDLQALFPKTAIHRKLTFEYTGNPQWLMLLTLPALAQGRNDNAISLASAYYANTISHRLLNTTPQFTQLLNLWRNETGNNATLNGELYKNQEFKNSPLNTTPWEGFAQSEALQRQSIVNYFDVNMLANAQAENLKKLAELQLSDGSFTWFTGMPGNVHITTSVLTTLLRLNIDGKIPGQVQSMLSRAMGFLNTNMENHVKQLKKDKADALSLFELQYLYAATLFDRQGGTTTHKLSATSKTYLLHLLNKQSRHTSITQKALAAIILGKDSKTAHELVQSIAEYTVFNPSVGRYFDTNKAEYSWCDYRIPTQVWALEAMNTLQQHPNRTMLEMAQWLLSAKRTQQWDTPINTVNAVHTFFNLMPTPSGETIPQVSIDGKSLVLPKTTVGTNYVKTTIDNTKGRQFTAHSQGSTTAWGALYAQYDVKGTESLSASSGIQVKRDIVKAMPSQRDNHALIGQKLRIRITITADRDYDFVEVIDQRPACLEPVTSLSGYRNGSYVAPGDKETRYFFQHLSKGTHVIETEYYADKAGSYQAGTCRVQCAYSPEFGGQAPGYTLTVE